MTASLAATPAPRRQPSARQLIALIGVVSLALIVAGAMMAIQSRRGEGGEHTGRIGMGLAGVIVISAAAALVGFLA